MKKTENAYGGSLSITISPNVRSTILNVRIFWQPLNIHFLLNISIVGLIRLV
jgi:hypothetical protein